LAINTITFKSSHISHDTLHSFMASELLQRDPAEQSPGQLKKEAEVNELLQQASQSSITAIGCRSVVKIDQGNPSCSNPLTIVHSSNAADPPRGV